MHQQWWGLRLLVSKNNVRKKQRASVHRGPHAANTTLQQKQIGSHRSMRPPLLALGAPAGCLLMLMCALLADWFVEV